MKKLLRRIGPETEKCLALLAYWPIYGMLFYFAEHFFRPGRYHVMYCALDDRIPFCELFLIPYLFWFIYMVGIHVYTLFLDQRAFQRLMQFIILSYSIGLVFFYCYPTIQLLRPDVFPRDNLLTDMMAAFYRTDTNTNVCPSLHVVGSMAVFYAAKDTKLFQHKGWRLFFYVATFLICISTVFLKQHSVIDVVVGMLVSWCVAGLVYRKEELPLPARTYRSRRKMSY